MGRISFITHNQCTACGACMNICPKNCITMKLDDEKFLYPEIDENECINCNMCSSICPVKNKKDCFKEANAFAVIHKDSSIREESSSGGAFSIIAEFILENNGLVVGVSLSDDCRFVYHKVIESKEQLAEIRGSKYVQSSIGYSFRTVKKYLEEGRKVLFAGTPCQISGLKSFLGIEYNELITIDLICHGVPSQYVWSKYVQYREKKASSVCQSVSFRNKSTGWKTYSLVMKFKNGDIYSKQVNDDLYLKAFLNNSDLRECCYKCDFKGIDRISDFTLADLWGCEKLCHGLECKNGISLVLTHNDKALNLLDMMSDKGVIISVDLDIAISNNEMAIKSIKKHPKRKKFLENLDLLPFDVLVEKYAYKTYTLREKVGYLKRKIISITMRKN